MAHTSVLHKTNILKDNGQTYKKIKILYLFDPQSPHDLKWMQFFTESNEIFGLARNTHRNIVDNKLKLILKNNNIQFLGFIEDFTLKNPFATLATVLNISQIIKDKEINIFHIFFAEPNALWCIFKNTLNVPVIITTRGTDILKTIPFFFASKSIRTLHVRYLYTKAFNAADLITSTSIQQIKKINQLFKPKTAVELIRTGIDYALISQDHSKQLPTEVAGKKYLFFPRNITPVYDHELAISAINKLSQHTKDNYYFVFIDADRANSVYKKRIGDLIKKSSGRIIWLKKLTQTEFWATLSKSQLVVMTPLSDGSPVSALEALTLGKTIILPPLDYDLDIFQGAIMFSERSPDCLAKCIEDTLKNVIMNWPRKQYNEPTISVNRDIEMSKLSLLYKRISKK